MTNNLTRRISIHRSKNQVSFTSKYNIYKLVYYERFSSIYNAIGREKQLKKWKRKWKVDLILSLNPEIKDLLNDPYFGIGI